MLDKKIAVVSAAMSTPGKEKGCWETAVSALGGNVRTKEADVIVILRASLVDVKEVRRLNETATILAVLPEGYAVEVETARTMGADFICGPLTDAHLAKYVLDRIPVPAGK